MKEMGLDDRETTVNAFTGERIEPVEGSALSASQIDRLIREAFAGGEKGAPGSGHALEDDTKQFPEPTPTGHALPPLEGQPEITPEQVAEALRDWDAKAPRGWQGLLLTEKVEGGG